MHKGGNAKTAILCLVFSFTLLPLAAPTLAQPADTCLMCHSDRSLAMKKSGRDVALFVDGAVLKNSAHGALSCVDCHVGLNTGNIPHAKVIEPVQCRSCHDIAGFEKSVHGMPLDKTGKGGRPVAECKSCHGTHEVLSFQGAQSADNRKRVSRRCGTCHEKEQAEFPMSAHGKALAADVPGAPTCVVCHGSHTIVSKESKESPFFKTREARLCLKCHLDDPAIQERIGLSAGFIAGYETSVHGTALASGNLRSASCSDCHGSHGLRKASDPSSRVNKWNIAQTCSRCHLETASTYAESIHGVARQKGKAEAPTCTDCHGEHQIYARGDPRSRVAPKNVSAQVCAPCHDSAELAQKYGLMPGQFTSFSDSYHGLASRAGSVEVANCASCHGAHNIKPSADPASTVHRANLPATCGQAQCHPGANENFAKGTAHVHVELDSEAKVLYWIQTIYIYAIAVIVGTMFLHNLLDFVKKTRFYLAERRGEAVREQYSTTQYLRMTLNERLQHALMFTSFMLLVLTGFMLRFPDAWWVMPVRRLSESFFAVRTLLHRVAGIVMIATSVYHLFYVFFTRRGAQFIRDMRPRLKDAGDIWTNLLYLTGFSRQKPLFDRFSYIEKVEYWALVWGVVVMAATGIVMWFDNYFINLITKLGYDVSRTIHFYEACLATLAIFVWHLYFVIFRPGVYPMSMAWLTGEISEEEMAEEHPLELARIRSRRLHEGPAVPPSESTEP